MRSSGVEGRCEPGFEVVAEAFADNFAKGHEVGAAFAVSRGGELVVDLWGGSRGDTAGSPWEASTVCPVFSGTKGLVAVCLGLALQTGQIRLIDSVSSYWPEFGKPSIRVRDIVAHTSQLPGLATDVTVDEFLDSGRMAALLAEQAAYEDPRAQRCYHPFTFGWLCAELLRRACGRPLAEIFREEIAQPLGLELWIGLPKADEGRVAVLSAAGSWMRQAFPRL